MNRPKTVVAAALLAGALAVLLTAPAADAGTTASIWIKYNDLPRRCREVVDRERGRCDVKQILEMRTDGRVFFRVLIDERGADRAIYVSEGGRVVKESEVPDVPVGFGSFEKFVRYDDLPREVRRTLDHERGRFEVKVISFVRRDNREFYRAIVDTRGDDTAIRINVVGKLLSIDEVDDLAVGAIESRRYDYTRERSVRFDDLPRAVRAVIQREADGRPLKQLVFVERNGRAFYRCVIDDRKGDRILRIAEDGYAYAETEVPDIAVGPGGFDANHYGHEATIRHADLPWSVRECLDRERRNHEVKQILYVRRGSYTFYRCVYDTKGDDVAIRISDDGRLLSREEVEDVAYGKGEADDFGGREEWVKVTSLPRAPREVIDRYRRGRAVLSILRCEHRGNVVYRCSVDSRPYPTTIRITEEGRVIGD